MSLPTGTVTFLFTDIEGSTKLWEQYPKAMKAALAWHDAILRQAVEVHSGHVIKTTGDGIHAVFASANDLIGAVIQAQQLLQAESWDEIQPQTIRVRMGAHTGEAELRDGDYYGQSLNRAARLMAVASGGQILLSEVTARLVDEHLPPGVTLLDMGDRRLKDLIRPEHIFQVVAAGLLSDFPPLKTLDSFHHNLPIQLTSFIGREKEISEVKQLLAERRLVTLTGPGGTGKTRLSLQVAADLIEAFRDGVWFIELAPITDPALVAVTVLTTLGLREDKDRPAIKVLTDYLQNRRALLIFDNCEHLVESSAQVVNEVLQACAQVKILGSSREALGVGGETPFRVPSLSVPDSLENISAGDLNQFESVRLFVERATMVQSNFSVTSENASALTQVCRRLDGIPLAIELAAARVRMMKVSQIAARLDDSFSLLTGGSRTALPRQQTLRALIDWSYNLLPEAERKLLARLSVFVGGWSLEAAEAICSGEGIEEVEILDLLTQLANKSLVVVDDSGDEIRYRLLETIRQYARDKLLDFGEAASIRTRHLNYFVNFVDTAVLGLLSPQVVTWRNRWEVESGNVHIAVQWGLQYDPQAALELVSQMTYEGSTAIAGSFVEVIHWLTEALALVEALPTAEGEQLHRRMVARGRGLVTLGAHAAMLGDYDQARPALKNGILLLRKSGDKRELAWALAVQGTGLFTMQEGGEDALANAQEGLALFRELNDLVGQALTLVSMASLLGISGGDLKSAREHLKEGIRLLEQAETPQLAGLAFLEWGRIATIEGMDAEAGTKFEKSMELFMQLQDPFMINMARSELAHVLRRKAEYARALTLYREALVNWQQMGMRAAIAHELECFAFIARTLEQPARAATLLGSAEILRERIGSSMAPHERVEYDQELKELQVKLGKDKLEQAWSQGRSLSMEQAIMYALDETLSM